MNSKTFYTLFVTARDDKNPGVVAIDGPAPRIFGYPVIFSDKIADSVSYFGNFFEGMIGNFAQDIEIKSSEDSGFRSNGTDFRGSAIFDCSPRGIGLIVKSAASL